MGIPLTGAISVDINRHLSISVDGIASFITLLLLIKVKFMCL